MPTACSISSLAAPGLHSFSPAPHISLSFCPCVLVALANIPCYELGQAQPSGAPWMKFLGRNAPWMHFFLQQRDAAMHLVSPCQF